MPIHPHPRISLPSIPFFHWCCGIDSMRALLQILVKIKTNLKKIDRVALLRAFFVFYFKRVESNETQDKNPHLVPPPPSPTNPLCVCINCASASSVPLASNISLDLQHPHSNPQKCGCAQRKPVFQSEKSTTFITISS